MDVSVLGLVPGIGIVHQSDLRADPEEIEGEQNRSAQHISARLTRETTAPDHAVSFCDPLIAAVNGSPQLRWDKIWI